MQSIGIAVVALVLLFVGQWMLTKTKQEAGATRHIQTEQANIAQVETSRRLAALLNPWAATDCVPVTDAIPKTAGDWCKELQQGKPITIDPMPGTRVEAKVKGRTQVHYLDRDKKLLKEAILLGQDDEFICAPPKTDSMTLTPLVEGATVRVLVNKPKSPDFAKCS